MVAPRPRRGAAHGRARASALLLTQNEKAVGIERTHGCKFPRKPVDFYRSHDALRMPSFRDRLWIIGFTSCQNAGIV
jgi:hypothetical protein